MISDYGRGFPRPASRKLLARAFARDAVLRRLDWTLLLAVAALSAVGVLLVWSATRTQLLHSGADPRHYLEKQLFNVGLGVVGAAAFSWFDYRLLRAYAPFAYVACCLALVLTLTPLGVRINGSSSWLDLGVFRLQPSEFAKVGLVLLLAMVLAETRDGEANPRDRDVVRALVVAAVPMGFILMQPDLGTSLVFAVLVLGMIAVSGAPRRWLFGLVAGAALTAFAVVYFHVLKPYQMARFTSFVRPSAASEGTTYSAEQARTAIGSGGLFGDGLFSGSLTNGQYVPEQQSDFIFTVAGEELGFVGSAAIVVVLGLLLWRALRIAARAEGAFGTLVAGGVVCWFGFQTFQNIGMTLGLMPITGLPLPFVSYGGSSTIADFIAVGLLINIHLTSTRSSMGRMWNSV